MRRAGKAVSRTARTGNIVVQTYRGYGSDQRIVMKGRVFREPVGARSAATGLESKLSDLWRLMRAWGVGDARLSVRFGEVDTSIKTDPDGYFLLDLELPKPPPSDRYWHRVHIRLEAPVAIDTEGEVFIPRTNCSLGVICDIDDTVMRTGVANKFMMMRRLFVQGADSRTAFPGMASFLRALHLGAEQRDANPMLYVSRAPWAIYDVLARFFNLHGIPVGPILFLRDWGLTLQYPLPRLGRGHKINLICQMIEHYSELSFVLIGDSGQRDPEIYAEIVQRFPNRISAIYIRDVSNNPKRAQAIGEMAMDLAGKGCRLVLAVDTLAMASHAYEQGLIGEKALIDIQTDIEAGA